MNPESTDRIGYPPECRAYGVQPAAAVIGGSHRLKEKRTRILNLK